MTLWTILGSYGTSHTLPRKILLCPINWGTQWTIEKNQSSGGRFGATT